MTQKEIMSQMYLLNWMRFLLPDMEIMYSPTFTSFIWFTESDFLFFFAEYLNIIRQEESFLKSSYFLFLKQNLNQFKPI